MIDFLSRKTRTLQTHASISNLFCQFLCFCFLLRYALQSRITFPITYYFDPFWNYVEDLNSVVTLLLEVFRKTEKSNGSGLIFRGTDIFFKESFNLWYPLLMIAFYHQTQTKTTNRFLM